MPCWPLFCLISGEVFCSSALSSYISKEPIFSFEIFIAWFFSTRVAISALVSTCRKESIRCFLLGFPLLTPSSASIEFSRSYTIRFFALVGTFSCSLTILPPF